MQSNAAVVQFPLAPVPVVDTDATEPSKGGKRTIKNAKSIGNLPLPTEEGQTIDYALDDARYKGLWLRVTSNGIKTWSLRYPNPRVKGKMERLTLGRYPALLLKHAQDKFNDVKRQLADGVDPKEVRATRAAAVTFGELAHKWKTDHAEPKTKGQGTQEMKAIRRELTTWFPRVADEITKLDVIEFHTRITREGHAPMANRLRGHVSAIYNWGRANDYVKGNPTEFVMPNAEESRDRVLSEDEIRRVWAACDELPVHKRVWFRLRLVTGQRASELLQMRWQDINPETHWWTIPKEFIKNGLGHIVYLNAMARELLAELPQLDPVWVFPNGPQPKGDGTMTEGANTSALDVMQNEAAVAEWLCAPERANILTERAVPLAGTDGWQRTHKSGITGHDMRRTMVTMLRSRGVDEKFTRKILNHMRKPRKAGRDSHIVYDRWALQDEIEAVGNYWDDALRHILAGGLVKELPRFAVDGKLDRLMRGIVALQRILKPKTWTDEEQRAWDAFLDDVKLA